MKSKQCIDCSKVLPLEKFVGYMNKSKQRYRPYCKACRNIRERKMYNKRGKENQKIRSLKYKCKRYGTDLETVMATYELQQRRCAICGIDIKPPPCKSTHLDHCHTKGTFRGLLCNNCNLGLGHFKDNIACLQQAIEYLK